MTLQASGPLSMAQVAAELGISPNGLALNDARVLKLAGLSSPPISMSQLYGKSNAPVYPPLVLNNATDTSTSTNASGTTTVYANEYASASGGTGTYLWNWQFLSGNNVFSINNPNIGNPTFSTNIPINTTYSAVWRVSLSDTNGSLVIKDITVYAYNTYVAPTYPPLSVSAPVAYVNGTDNVPAYYSVSSTANPSGGSGGYTYSWSYVSGATDIVINNSSLQSPTWTRYSNPGEDATAIWQVIVYDSRGYGASTTIHVEFNVTVYSGGGG